MSSWGEHTVAFWSSSHDAGGIFFFHLSPFLLKLLFQQSAYPCNAPNVDSYGEVFLVGVLVNVNVFTFYFCKFYPCSVLKKHAVLSKINNFVSWGRPQGSISGYWGKFLFLCNIQTMYLWLSEKMQPYKRNYNSSVLVLLFGVFLFVFTIGARVFFCEISVISMQALCNFQWGFP